MRIVDVIFWLLFLQAAAHAGFPQVSPKAVRLAAESGEAEIVVFNDGACGADYEVRLLDAKSLLFAPRTASLPPGKFQVIRIKRKPGVNDVPRRKPAEVVIIKTDRCAGEQSRTENLLWGVAVPVEIVP